MLSKNRMMTVAITIAAIAVINRVPQARAILGA